MIAGRPADTAPISCAGTVLSQPPISTTASIGCARTISSVSIDIRLRNFMLVGERNTSPSDTVGNSIGSAPAASTPRFTASQQLGEMPVAIVEAGRRIGDADHRLVQHGAGIAHRLRERAAQITGKIAVAVIGEAVRDADGFFAHADHFVQAGFADCKWLRPAARGGSAR